MSLLAIAKAGPFWAVWPLRVLHDSMQTAKQWAAEHQMRLHCCRGRGRNRSHRSSWECSMSSAPLTASADSVATLQFSFSSSAATVSGLHFAAD